MTLSDIKIDADSTARAVMILEDETKVPEIAIANASKGGTNCEDSLREVITDLDMQVAELLTVFVKIAESSNDIQKAGYVPDSAFTLPENCWIDNYFIPQKRRRQSRRGFYRIHEARGGAVFKI